MCVLGSRTLNEYDDDDDTFDLSFFPPSPPILTHIASFHEEDVRDASDKCKCYYYRVGKDAVWNRIDVDECT